MVCGCESAAKTPVPTTSGGAHGTTEPGGGETGSSAGGTAGAKAPAPRSAGTAAEEPDWSNLLPFGQISAVAPWLTHLAFAATIDGAEDPAATEAALRAAMASVPEGDDVVCSLTIADAFAFDPFRVPWAEFAQNAWPAGEGRHFFASTQQMRGQDGGQGGLTAPGALDGPAPEGPVFDFHSTPHSEPGGFYPRIPSLPVPIHVQLDAQCQALADKTGTSALAARSADPRADRPIQPLLCQWLSEGWASLSSPMGPADIDPLHTPYAWSPRFPYEGPTPTTREIYQGWPASPNSPVAVKTLPVPTKLLEDGIDPSTTSWAHLTDNVWVMLRHEASGAGFIEEDLAVVGLAWRTLKAAMPQLLAWYQQTVERWATLGFTKIAGMRPLSLWNVHEAAGYSDDLLSITNDWATGLAGEPVTIWARSEYMGGTLAGANSASQTIVIRGENSDDPPQVSAVRYGGELRALREAALSAWSAATYPNGRSLSGTVQFSPQIPQDIALAAAGQVARVAARLAHELLHISWRRTAGFHGHWGSRCAGFKIDPSAPDAWSYEQQGSYSPYYGDGTYATSISKHWANYLFEAYLQGLLVHDVPGALADRDQKWCNNCETYGDRNCP